MENSTQSDDPFRILSLSGGGFLGLYTCGVLAALEQQSGKPISKNFDLLAGTSIGGIIALALAAEIPAQKIKEAFEKDGPTIFPRNSGPQSFMETLVDIITSAFRPKYSSDALRDTITSIIPHDMLVGDLKHSVIIPAINVTRGEPQLFKTPHHPTFKLDRHLRVLDVALATSAAPTYFPLAEAGASLFVDGGLYANSPGILALHEAQYFFQKPQSLVHLLSIGTTTSRFSFAHATGRALGWFDWMRDQRLVNVMIATQERSTDFMLRHLLQDRYLRLDEEQSKEQERYLGLDIATRNAQSTINGLSEATIRREINNQKLDWFLKQSAAEPIFF